MAHIDGRLELVAQGALFEGRRRMVDVWAHFVDSGWSDVVWRGSRSIFSPPSMCLRNLRTSTINSDQMVAIALGDNGEVLVIQQRGPDGRSDWTEWVGANPMSGPRLVAAGQPIIIAEPGTGAKVHILAINARGELFATSDLGAGLLLTWTPWEQLDSPSAFDYLDANCRLATVVTDRVYVFARSQRGEILEIEFVPGRGWGHWINLGGETESDLSAGFHADGRIEVVARAQSDSQLHARRQISPGVWF